MVTEDGVGVLPPNVPERIVFCVDLDTSAAATSTAAASTNGPRTFTRLEHVKQAISTFVHAKSNMSPAHSYAICALVESALWYLDFTSDVNSFLDQLYKLESSGSFDNFDMSSLFSILHDKLELLEGNQTVMRAVLLYTRSSVIPEASQNDPKRGALLGNPRFFYDTLYLHDPPSADNNPQDVYDALVCVEHEKNDSYLFENSTNIRRFYYNMMLLLAHPMQRPTQDEFRCNLGEPDLD